MVRVRKRQVCFRLDENLVKELEAVREKTGVPVGTQIELRLKGFAITNVERSNQGLDISSWMNSLEKDEELADHIDEAVDRMRGLKLG